MEVESKIRDVKPDYAAYLAYGKYMLQQVLADSDIVVCTLLSAGQNIIREAISLERICKYARARPRCACAS